MEVLHVVTSPSHSFGDPLHSVQGLVEAWAMAGANSVMVKMTQELVGKGND